MHFSNNPSVVMLSYMFISEIELMNVISLIEGVRYKLDTKDDEFKHKQINRRKT